MQFEGDLDVWLFVGVSSKTPSTTHDGRSASPAC